MSNSCAETPVACTWHGVHSSSVARSRSVSQVPCQFLFEELVLELWRVLYGSIARLGPKPNLRCLGGGTPPSALAHRQILPYCKVAGSLFRELQAFLL